MKSSLKKSRAPKAEPPRCRTRVLVLGSSDKPQVREQAELLRPAIEAHAEIVGWDMTFGQSLADIEADLALVLGGDGSILRAVRQMGEVQRPVLGVNLGRLGFLADLSPGELVDHLPRICAGDFKVIEHLMFDCQVVRDGQQIERQLGLNEVAVLAGAPFSVLEVHLYVDEELVTTYSCDGLIISTPVGSTAHNLSAGGPILRKDLRAFVISPLSPHTLSMRPVVDTADRVYEMVVPHPNQGTAVVVDGQQLCALLPGDRVRVVPAPQTFKLVEIAGHSYYRTLRDKLGWGGRLNR